MKKILLMMGLMLGTISMQAQEISVNLGTTLSERVRKLSGDDQQYIGYLEVSGDLFKKSKLRLGPVAKVYNYGNGLKKAIASEENHYSFSGGLEVGYDFNDEVTFGVGFELPLPDQRENISEGVISPSIYIGGEGLGLKVSYDYFINKRLFEYSSALSAGVYYKF